MRVIDLLNKIANGEEVPKKFIYADDLFILDEENNVYRSNLGNRFGAMYQLDIKLNDEVEILDNEDEDIEEIDFKTAETQKEKNRIMKVKINELVKEVNKLKKEGK